MKKISIITVVKDGLPYLKSAIQSVKEQKKSSKSLIEHIIVCSPSSDGTEEFLKNTNGVKVIFDEVSKNKFGSLNLGIINSDSDCVGMLHADDVFYDQLTIQSVLDNFDDNTDVIYGNILFSDNNDLSKINRNWVSSQFKKYKIFMGWMPPHTSIFVRKKVLLENLYETNFPISGDYLFIVKLFKKKNLNFKFLNKYITIMRSGGDSTKIKNFFKKICEDYKILKIFFKFPILILILKIITKIHQFRLIKYRLNNIYINKLNQ